MKMVPQIQRASPAILVWGCNVGTDHNSESRVFPHALGSSDLKVQHFHLILDFQK